MAGVMAMASVIEDFDTQPCKKSRKDGDSPVVKTITNYFSPVSKPTAKPFSPPRSSNIMDYFSRKVSSSKEKTSPAEPWKVNGQNSHSAEKHTNPEAGKQLSQKKGRKSSKAARKRLAVETVSTTDDMSCLVVEEPQESKSSEVHVVSSYGIAGSNTAAPLSQLSAEACTTAGEVTGAEINSDGCAESSELQEDDSKCENGVRPEPALNTSELLPKDRVKPVKTAAQKTRKRLQKEAKHPEPEVKEPECDVCMDEASQLNNSTVKISFEDFLRSQNEIAEDRNDVGKDEASKITSEIDELNSEQLDVPKADENVVPSVQISPRTVTIQAEVHVVSPKQIKADGKVASIFSRRKRANNSTDASTNTEPDHQPSSSPLTGKRRSNVVLQEEDLELAVLESESTPKCSEAEKKQFMAAFKQPSMDGSRIKPVKSQGKQKQAEEKTVDVPDPAVEDDVVLQPSTEQLSQESKSATKKGRKKATNKNDAASSPAASAVEEAVVTLIEDDDQGGPPPITSPPSVPAVRRSRREAVVRQTPQTIPTTPVRKNRKQNESKDAVITVSPQDSPIKIRTPKTRRSKHGVFVAEIVSTPEAKESPIRIRFSRIQSKADAATSATPKKSSESKNRKQAKKLLEKAKVIQQSKNSTVEKEALRRSSRSKTSIKKSYCEDEDSVICMEDLTTAPQIAPETSKTKKTLRSLNDVLGKAAPASKDTKASPVSKVAPPGQEKPARKASAVISIFDESSHEGSENSQDDGQFRARREFLKSGLPESFKKQMAKTAASKEAYTLTCSSFQPVTHTTQPPEDCPLWNLPWPQSLLLCHLKELWSRTPNPLPSISGSLCLETVPSYRRFSDKGTGWRPEITESIRQLLVEEFGTSNPHFPAQMFITRLLKRRANHQQQFAAPEPEAVIGDNTSTSVSAEPVGGKRKRKDNEGENTAKVAKKQRSNRSEESTSLAEPEPPKRGGRTRRARRSRLQEEEEEGLKDEARTPLQSAPIQIEDDSIVVLDELPLGKDARKKDVMEEDVLWTDKYQPQHSSDIIDNAASVKRLHSWLKEWKLRTDREERKKQKEKKQEEDSNDSDWDCREEDSQEGVDVLCNTMLITGPTGVGKTAAVYACAQELGFKVFEVNASSQRSGRLILSQLKEATQSHQVDNQGVNAHKPAYFNSYATSSSAGSVRPGSSPRKANSPRRVVSSPRKQPQSPRGAKRGGLPPVSLANFFKINQPTNKELPNTVKNDKLAASKKVGKVLSTKSSVTSTLKKNKNEEQSKKSATSLILFEEVDVIFDDDSGFLSAIKTFMTTTKRPVILTTSDPSFSSVFDGNFEEIHFKTPSVLNVSSYLQLLCLAEDVRTDPSDVRSLLKLNGCDIRQSLLQLQFWTRSAGGQMSHTSENLITETKEAADKSSAVSCSLPLRETGCTEGKLGLLNIKPTKDFWELLRGQSLIKEAICWELLTDSRQRGVDLLYSNLENLLPLPVTQLTTSKLCKPEPKCPQADTVPPSTSLLIPVDSDGRSDSDSPIKVSSRMRNKKQRKLPDQDGLHSESDSEDGFPSLCTLQRSSRAEKEVKESVVSEKVKRKHLSQEECVKSVPVSQCLESMADFLDDMSYVDSFLLFQPDGCNAHRRMSPVSAVIKDGMTDESRIETDQRGWSTGGRFFEIQATVEALSFHKCRDSVSESWRKVQQLEGELGKEATEELTLPVATHREDCSFTQDAPCQPQLVQRRRELMENLTFKGVFGTLGNKQAAALDYLPVMRAICRSEQLKEQGKVKRRFLHYLDAIHLGLEKSTLQLLSEDFP